MSFNGGGGGQHNWHVRHMYAPPQNALPSQYGAAAGGMFQPSPMPTISYPPSRLAFHGGAPVAAAPQPQPQPQQYNSYGTVTKISNDCGLVNDEVFFYQNVCKGGIPKLGDRVLFEANSSVTGQFKWNATHVQVMQSVQEAMRTAGPPSRWRRCTRRVRGGAAASANHRRPI